MFNVAAEYEPSARKAVISPVSGDAFESVEGVSRAVRRSRGSWPTTDLFTVILGCSGCGGVMIENAETGLVVEGEVCSCRRRFDSIAPLTLVQSARFRDFEPTLEGQKKAFRFRQMWTGSQSIWE